MAVPSKRYQDWLARNKPKSPRSHTAIEAKRHPNPDIYYHIPRCQAQTASGQQCKHEAQHNKDFCSIHKDAK